MAVHGVQTNVELKGQLMKTDENKYNSIRKIRNAEFPDNRLCWMIYNIKNFADRLVILGQSGGGYGNADTIYQYHKESKRLSPITRGVYPAHDMCVTSAGDIVVTREKKPALSVFNSYTGEYLDINITHDGKAIDVLRQVETDEADNMFVSYYGGVDHLIIAVNHEGHVINSVEARRGSGRMAYSRMTRILYWAANDRILRFLWNNNILKEISSSLHNVPGFRCDDVCIGDGGEVLVAGKMDPDYDIIIYQVVGKDNLVEWKEIRYEDQVKRRYCYSDPRICTKAGRLWLGYNHNLEIFQLS
jgi:hypothetical protein